MKPDTILEALVGKIAKDADCVGRQVQPETKMETYIDKIGRQYEFAPVSTPMNVGGFLMSAGTDGAVWVKPLNVMFSGNDPETYCSRSYEEIISAYNTGKPINAYYSDGGRQYNLSVSAYAPDIHTLLFSGVCLIPDNGSIVTLKIACSINIGNGVEIVVIDGN